MTIESLDWQVIATVATFVATYAGVALGRIPGFRIDRAGIALLGASAMIAAGVLSLEDAFNAIDLDTIALLLGMMIIVGQLRVSGFFELASRFAIQRARGPVVLLAAIVIVTGFFSAFLVNDAICLVMTPLVIEVARVLRRNPVPYLLAAAMASNAGSVATFTGNPQNMIIGIASHIPYADFAARLAPVAAAALALILCLVGLFHPTEFSTPFATVPKQARPRQHIRQIRKGLLVSACVVVAFFLGVPIAKAAIIGGSILLVSRAVNPRKIYAGIDGRLLLMFAGLFIVVAAAEKILLSQQVMAATQQLHLENAWILSAATALLSNLVSNVPAVLALKPFIADLADSHRAWLIVAMSSTLAGNLTLIGSVANLIVAERAKAAGVKISFLDHLKVGLPLTALSLAFGTWWLAR
ncbi:anion transporter [Methylocapsa polymorpha]|uniref:Anion transporter n=1 Tax=Methylocapsa polymorpha TaxID=3080828 RepID=A0ABZ0HU72_9HYPH|nr:anion transporter [Methylocapsa sp. RX1]